ncbi:MAG TPA: glycosyltransferase family 2 protein, partial [Gammaproteobacteria bacterium]
RCRGDIVLLADARQRFAADVLRKLTAHFIDPKVGAVSGELLLLAGSEDTAAGEGVGFYWKYEKFMRRNESRIDSTIGATGAIYAIRRDLFEVIPTGTLLDDVLIPMRIVRRGYRVRFEPAARAFDREAPPQLEFIRKVRTLAGNFQLFIQEPWLLNPFSNRLWLQTVSHKGLRLLTPLCLVVVLLANLLLLDKLFYCWTLGMQSALYAAAVGGYLLRNGSKTIRILQIPYVFCLLNWAVVIGFVRFVNGRQRVTWERVSAHKETSAE